MFVIPLFKRELTLLSGSHDAQRHTRVNREICAVLSEMWYEIAVWFYLRIQKACSKGVTRYEARRTGSGASGENVEKTMLFRMHKLRWCTVSSAQKNVPRARDAESGSFKNGATASSAKISPGYNARKRRGNSSRVSQVDLSLVVILMN
ncbi:hypothetical protein [Gimesia aquarii]|uniref:Uncharacterized protein n=1 Tax=Gimesia aquarii TaxID=2527964 RepID=A0A517W173_9PLAN|nr:hypothetical protein [Gimesia aquarii]QDT99007.1 hypothetical protein V144x_45170 [Gimesia aquarii]